MTPDEIRAYLKTLTALLCLGFGLVVILLCIVASYLLEIRNKLK